MGKRQILIVQISEFEHISFVYTISINFFCSITVRKDEFLHNDETLNILWSPIHAVWEGDIIGLGSKRSECIVLQELGKSSQGTGNIRLRSQEMEKLDYYPLKWYDESDLKKNELVHSFKVCKPNRSC